MFFSRLPAFLFLIIPIRVFSQAGSENTRDTLSKTLNEVTLKAYFHDQPMLNSPASAAVISLKQLTNFSPSSLVSAVNTVSGVRMEERSPGSYRLSIRGSLLRSPFGIRNVKIYLDGFSLTDAGGNTYLNLADAATLSRIEILKGPEGSIFGANTGGVILIDDTGADSARAVAGEIGGGSYGLFRENIALQHQQDKYKVKVQEAFQRSDGYRDNSALNRKYFSISQQFKYSPSSSLQSIILFSDLQYQTPGGLTLAQAAANPRAARPAAGKIPGAAQQQAKIFNQTVFGGLSYSTSPFHNLNLVTSLSGMHTDFKNPFITNYEVRNENSLNGRAFAEISRRSAAVEARWTTGFEAQSTWSDIRNFGNRGGVRDTLQSADKLSAAQDFIFSHLELNIRQRLIIEAAASFDFYGYRYQSSYPNVIAERENRLNNQLLPRFAAAYTLLPGLAIRSSVSKGYSAPTIAEVRASDNVINTGLQPEKGWNYEAGIRLKTKLFYGDASVFNFRLNQAIVRRVNAAGAEYFVNAGGTRQQGIESFVSAWLLAPRTHGIIQSVQVTNAATFSNFSFRNYLNGTADFSGNKLTGVAGQRSVSGLEIGVCRDFQFFLQHDFTAAIPLDDANTVFSTPSNVFQTRVSWRKWAKSGAYSLRPYFGINNLFGARYSLGNDLNAVGGRYFNPSPEREYYAGVSMGM